MEVLIRYFFPGQRRQDGRIIRRNCRASGRLSAMEVRDWLVAVGISLDRFVPFVYNYELEGFMRLPDEQGEVSEGESVPLPPYEPKMIDVRLDPLGPMSAFTAVGCTSLSSEMSPMDVAGGWFGIGILRGKTEANHGTLWRTALQLGAAFVFTIGQRYRAGSEERSNDTSKVYRHMPMLRFETIADFGNSSPYNAPWVAVEMGGTPLHQFQHPTCAVYILGAEDHGLPKSVVADSAHHVTIPSVRPQASSYNVATAGAILMYDRYLKSESAKAS